jgi:carboxyl-terminal processing protease
MTSRTASLAACTLTVTLLLSACGGGGGGGGSASPTASGPAAPDPIPADFAGYQNLCARPRSGVDANGLAFPDRQGTLLDELKFLRGWADRNYLWYDEIPSTVRMADYSDALGYFGALKTPALTASGKAKDGFHFTYTTAEWNALSNAGQEVGYGLTWSRNAATPPRTWLVTIVEPGSPAARAGVQRGDMLDAVDGVDFVNTSSAAGVATINAGLFPKAAGESHRLRLRRGDASFDVALGAAVVASDSVKNAKVIDSATGKVGYLTFDDFNAVAEKQLIDAFTMFRSEGASDLVIDMRYNGGGLLYIASELAYMVAGPATAGQTFERLQYNGKTAPGAPIPFLDSAYGFPAPVPARAGQALPWLGLKRVTVLTTAGTCSASEAVINGLRGVDVQVDIIGAQTCGKPYGFTPVDNCGTTYFSIEFQGVNAKGFGDFADGFAPTCMVPDDLSRAQGDPAEGLLAAALAYRSAGTCRSSRLNRASVVQMELVRPEAKEIAVLPRR